MKHGSIWFRIGLFWGLEALLVGLFFPGWAHDDPPYRRAERSEARMEYKRNPAPATKAAFDSELRLKRQYEVQVIALALGVLFLITVISVNLYEFSHERRGS